MLLDRRGQFRADEGKYKEAEALYKQAVNADETKYGPDHPKVADDLDMLARLYRDAEGFPIEEAGPLSENPWYPPAELWAKQSQSRFDRERHSTVLFL